MWLCSWTSRKNFSHRYLLRCLLWSPTFASMVVGSKVVSVKRSSHWVQMRMQKDCCDNSKVAKYRAQTKRSKFISKCPKLNFLGGTNKLHRTMDQQMWLSWRQLLREITRTFKKGSIRHQECFMAQINCSLPPQKSLCSISMLLSLYHQITIKDTYLKLILKRLIIINNNYPWTTWTLNSSCNKWNSDFMVQTKIAMSGTSIRPKCSIWWSKMECSIRCGTKECHFQTQ